MDRKNYLSVKRFFKKHKNLFVATAALSMISELAVYISYPLFLLLLIINKNLYCIRSIAVCGIGFLLISFIRAKLNFKRPYEKFDFSPLIKKERLGHSFPSRHVFSASVIGMSLLAVYPVWGFMVLSLALIMAVLRVLLGVHFIKDTAAGAAAGILIGLICFI